mgnify:CR=1 FL=1
MYIDLQMSYEVASTIDLYTHNVKDKSVLKSSEYISYTDSRKELEKYKSSWNSQYERKFPKNHFGEHGIPTSIDILDSLWIEVVNYSEPLSVQNFHKLFKKITVIGSEVRLVEITPVILDFIYNFMKDEKKKIYENLVKKGCLLIPLDLVLPCSMLPYTEKIIRIETNVEYNLYGKCTILDNEERRKMVTTKEMKVCYNAYDSKIQGITNLSSWMTDLRFRGHTKELMFAIRDKDTHEYIPNLIDSTSLVYEQTERCKLNSLQSSVINPSMYKDTIGSYEIHLISYGSNDACHTDFSQLNNIALYYNLNSKEVFKYFLRKLVMVGLTSKNLFEKELMSSGLLIDIFNFSNERYEVQDTEKNLELCVVQVKNNLCVFTRGSILFPYLL